MAGKKFSLHHLLLIAAIIVFFSLMAGYLLRFNPGGLACPDFPTCYGRLAIPDDTAARLEMAHRVISALGGLLTVAATVWALLARASRGLRRMLIAASGLHLAQVGFGAGLVFVPQPVILPVLHLIAALLILGLVTGAVTVSYYQAAGCCSQFDFNGSFARLAITAMVSVFVLMVSGMVVSRLGAGSACVGFPLCDGGLPASGLGWLGLSHRLLTAFSGGLIVVLFSRAWKLVYDRPVLLSAATGVGVLFAGQALVGALKTVRNFPLELVGLHAAINAGIWAMLVLLVFAAGLSRLTTASERAALAVQRPMGIIRLGAFLKLNKPIIVALLLVTTYAGMVVGGRQIPAMELTLWTLLGGALAAGGSSALNQYIDRRIDGAMQRTANRPLPAGILSPAEALAYGLGACLAAFFILAGFVNLLAALLSLAGMVYYILIYSIWLKYMTAQNIVIGGGAGAIPPLVGWAAATGSLNFPSLFLFALVFIWTPPHFWALALVRAKDYARAGVPMLPVVRGEKETRNQIFIYTAQLVALTLLMPVFKVAGSLFLVSAVVLGLWLLYTAWKVVRTPGNKVAWQMYRYSSMYLAFIFLALVADVLM
ncbi:MAG: heme o synthase [Bellilinea sp.]